MLWDVIVIGGGPCGGEVARSLSKKNYDVLVLEEHTEIGRPVQCAGLISGSTFAFSDVGRRCVLHHVDTLSIHSPYGRTLRVRDRKNKPVVIDRAIFDKLISESAINNGAKYLLSKKVKDVKRDNDAWKVICGKGEIFRCREIVDASGPGRIHNGSIEIIKCVQYMGTCRNNIEDVHVFLGRKVAPGFFAWIIPSGERSVNVGIGCTEGNAFHLLQSFMKSAQRVVGKFSPLGMSSGIIPIGRPVIDGMFRVGDAAVHVKPLTGGGLVYGLRGARACAECMHGDGIEKYEEYVRKEILPEIVKALKIRRIFLKIDDKKLDDLIKILNDECIDLIEEYGDMDSPTSLAKLLLFRSPALLKFAGPVVKALLDF